MPTTIKDIARKAGVSVTTVSKALNNYQDIKPETRKKILKIARELNYQPNTTARNLVLRKTNTIGLIISGLSTSRSAHHFLFDVICGINDQAYAKQYDVLLYGTNSESQKKMSYLDLCLQRNFDGVILMGVKTDDPYVREVVEADIPTVLIDVPIVSSTCGYVTTDNVKGAEMAVQHLLDLGHRQILMINGHRQAFVSLQREEGYKKALEANGLSYREDYVAYTDFESASGGQAAATLLQKHRQATAIFCASDLIAYGAITRLLEMGWRVPEDISVIGFDGIELGEIMTPALSTIYQNRYLMGASAVNMLMELLEGNEGYSRVLAPTLIQRESTADLLNPDGHV
ncbi:DNA-binding LacI/PurR family transcriptional regulator [Caldalkalibacillus uzonensis]|uniref:DNA-binding LacI/PurR family transcriptional regulator n=1 Tax=Caldalkalibacillus uzonensis TaxID=353224 RepID=A0ABU0CRG3_9BACI|nr:LacI family DNA-binding transcriptional regulator [Caldalkalibacillus uzonensis]MDQ0338990.1 DNA-binding LacI/PurR family transcriptional regulator [Caldalkalibacillus uzonensis]